MFQAEESYSWKYPLGLPTYNTTPLYGVSPRVPMKEFKYSTLFRATGTENKADISCNILPTLDYAFM